MHLVQPDHYFIYTCCMSFGYETVRNLITCFEMLYGGTFITDMSPTSHISFVIWSKWLKFSVITPAVQTSENMVTRSHSKNNFSCAPFQVLPYTALVIVL